MTTPFYLQTTLTDCSAGVACMVDLEAIPPKMSVTAVRVATSPFQGQKPGTSGLRKATKIFMGEHYTENFVQCTLSAMGDKLQGSTLVVGGDGRYYGKEAVETIIKMCAANGVKLNKGITCMH